MRLYWRFISVGKGRRNLQRMDMKEIYNLLKEVTLYVRRYTYVRASLVHFISACCFACLTREKRQGSGGKGKKKAEKRGKLKGQDRQELC